MAAPRKSGWAFSQSLSLGPNSIALRCLVTRAPPLRRHFQSSLVHSRSRLFFVHRLLIFSPLARSCLNYIREKMRKIFMNIFVQRRHFCRAVHDSCYFSALSLRSRQWGADKLPFSGGGILHRKRWLESKLKQSATHPIVQVSRRS